MTTPPLRPVELDKSKLVIVTEEFGTSIKVPDAPGAAIDAPQVFIRLDGLDLIDPRELANQCVSNNVSDKDFAGLANSWQTQSGRQPGVGKLLIFKEDFDLIKNEKFHTITAFDGKKEVEYNRLVLTKAQAILGGFSGVDLLPNSVLLVSVYDAREYAANLTSIAELYNITQPNCEFDKTTLDGEDPWTYQRLLMSIWQTLKPVFDTELTFHELNIGTPFPQNFDFLGMSAWEAFWAVLDSVGWSFALAFDGTGVVFDPSAASPDLGGLIDGIQNSLMDSRAFQVAPKLPETIYMVTNTKDFQWWQNPDTKDPQEGKLTAQDHYRRWPYYFKDFETAKLSGDTEGRIVTGTSKVFWAPLAIVKDDTGDYVNREQVDDDLEWFAGYQVQKLVKVHEWKDWTFSGVVPFRVGLFAQMVRYYDVGDGLKTDITSSPLELPGESYKHELASWCQHFVEPGQPNIIREGLPHNREIFGEVVSSEIETDESGLCFVFSGRTGTDKVTWTPRETVEAVNATGVTLTRGSRIFAVWNYQLGTCGEWCIVSTVTRSVIQQESDIALIRLKAPLEFFDDPKLGDTLDKSPQSCAYDGRVLAFTGDNVCKPAYVETEECFAFPFPEYAPDALLNYDEIYLGIEVAVVEVDGITRKLYGIVAETPKAQRIYNGGTKSIGRFSAFEVRTVENDPVERNANNYRLDVLDIPRNDYAHHGVAACGIPAGAYGWGWVSGTVPAKLDSRSPSHEYCDVRVDTSNLVSSFEGASRIIEPRLGNETGLSLVQLGILSDVVECAEFEGYESESRGAGLFSFEDNINRRVVIECLTTDCSFVVGDSYRVFFSRTHKQWETLAGPTAIKVKKHDEDICLKDSPAIDTATGAAVLASTQGIKFVSSDDPDSCEVLIGTDGHTEEIDLVFDLDCEDNNHIRLHKTTLVFECGLLVETRGPRLVTKDCCVSDCSPCPDCDEDCDEDYLITWDAAEWRDRDLVNCMTNMWDEKEVVLNHVDGCEYEGNGTTGCLAGECTPCTQEGDGPWLDRLGNECIECHTEDAQGNPLNPRCPPNCREGITDWTATLVCVNGIWNLDISGGTVGRCPYITWSIHADWPANEQCPDGGLTNNRSATLLMLSECEHAPEDVLLGEFPIVIGVEKVT